MTNEEKQLLIKDIGAKLPYGIKVKIGYKSPIIQIVETVGKNISGTDSVNGWDFNKVEIKPYLRPISSMTKEEIEEYIRLQHKDCIGVEKPTHCCKNSITAVVVTLTSRESMRYWYNDMVSSNTIDFLNERYLDWRGLIPLGLALEAPDNMYN